MPTRNNPSSSIVLFRQDLRLIDNTAISEAAKFGTVTPVFIHDESLLHTEWSMGGASKWWLHHSLSSLKDNLLKVGLQICIRQGDTLAMLKELASELQCTHIFWNRRYTPEHIKQDTLLKSQLSADGFTVKSFNSTLLSEPWEQLNKQGKPYKVFTPYWRHCQNKFLNESPINNSLNTPHLKPSDINPKGLEVNDLDLLPNNPNWAKTFESVWQPGENSAQEKWDVFLEGAVNDYDEHRNIPSIEGTSKLSPHLAFGEISTRQLWHDVQFKLAQRHSKNNKNLECYLSEIGWREFSYSLLYYFPHIPEKNFNTTFDNFKWDSDDNKLKAWQQGKTGYPLIDAGMRELWQTGYMHNRVRMVVASFLCKDLLLPWQLGAEWFWDTLLDADLASNSASWQWCAGSGADASPFFRVFNPITQSEKFDPDAEYILKWVPELSKLPKKLIHKPWMATNEILQQADIVLGETYPHPIVDHAEARKEALSRYQGLKNIST